MQHEGDGVSPIAMQRVQGAMSCPFAPTADLSWQLAGRKSTRGSGAICSDQEDPPPLRANPTALEFTRVTCKLT